MENKKNNTNMILSISIKVIFNNIIAYTTLTCWGDNAPTSQIFKKKATKNCS